MRVVFYYFLFSSLEKPIQIIGGGVFISCELLALAFLESHGKRYYYRPDDHVLNKSWTGSMKRISGLRTAHSKTRRKKTLHIEDNICARPPAVLRNPGLCLISILFFFAFFCSRPNTKFQDCVSSFNLPWMPIQLYFCTH